ncbi:MAG TPA: HAMP domain-containing sensor histidine kinase [Acidimicrobiia bacterium]
MKLPAWMRSVRFRLALTYSVVVFGLAFLVVFGVNVALSRSLADQPVSQQTQFRTFVAPNGAIVRIEETVRGRMVTLEQLVNARAREDLRRYSLLALLGMFPVSIGIGWLVANRAFAPIGKITKVAQDIQSTDLSQRIDLEGPDDELKQLADTFDGMLDRIEAGIDRQRSFVQDTSHELRNPLAVMAVSLDVALADDAADAATLRRTAEVVRRNVERTSRTVDDLLMFARSQIPESQLIEADLADLTGEVVEEHRAVIEEHRLALECDLDHVSATVDDVSVKRAVGNLIGNAVRLSPPNRQLRIGTGAVDGWAWIGVSDEGPGIAEEQHATMFRRHWSGDASSLGSELRAGLGLDIARQVAESHSGLITVESQPGVGATFVLWLPRGPGADPAMVTEDGIHPKANPLG